MHALLAVAATSSDRFPIPAAAERVTVEFEGVVTGILDDFDLLPEVASGTPFSGSYIYGAPLTPALCPPGLPGISGGGEQLPLEECAQYGSASSEGSINFTVAGQQFSFDNTEGPEAPLLIRIADGEPDAYLVQWIGVLSPLQDSVRLTVQDPEGALVSSTDLVVPDLSAAAVSSLVYTARSEVLISTIVFNPDTGEFEEITSGGGSSSFSGAITSLHVVPEPSAGLLLLGAALITLVVARRRERE